MSVDLGLVITLVLFVLVYGVFGVIDGVLMVRYGRRQLSEGEEGEAAAGRARTGRCRRPTTLPVLTY